MDLWTTLHWNVLVSGSDGVAVFINVFGVLSWRYLWIKWYVDAIVDKMVR